MLVTTIVGLRERSEIQADAERTKQDLIKKGRFATARLSR